MDTLKEEFSASKFSLRSPEDVVFHQSQWPRVAPRLYLAYRLLLAVYFLTCIIYSFVRMKEEVGHPSVLTLFLTSWSFFFQTLFVLSSASLVLIHFVLYAREEEDSGEDVEAATAEKPAVLDCLVDQGALPPKEGAPETSSHLFDAKTAAEQVEIKDNSCSALALLSSISWLLFNLVCNSALTVSLTYWAILYPALTEEFAWIPFPIDINFHLVNAITVLADIAICSYPIRLVHVVYSQFTGFIYMLFTLIYWSFDRENHIIYPILLDWNYPTLPLGASSMMFFVILPTMQLILFGLYKLRMYIFNRMYSTGS